VAAIGTGVASYEEACAQHRWDVPDRYNIARDVCDKHPRDKLAMVWEDWQGNERRVAWGELQSLANRAANVLAAHGVSLDAVADDGLVIGGQAVKLSLVAVNRGAVDVSVTDVTIAGFDPSTLREPQGRPEHRRGASRGEAPSPRSRPRRT